MQKVGTKKVCLAFLIAVVAFTFLISAVSAATLFSDGFESGNFNNWNESDNDWHVTTSGEHSGSYAALTTDQGQNPDDLRREVSTLGYNNINLGYWYRITESLGSHDHVYVQWTGDGSNWNTLVDYNNLASGDWTYRTISLPSGAINNPEFEIRFRASSLEDDDTFRLDDVLVTGDAISGGQPSDTTPPVCSVNKLGSYPLLNSMNYINAQGYYRTYGSANDSGSGFVSSSYPVSVNRTSPGPVNIWTWVVADDVSKSPDWNNVAWYNDFPTSGGRNDYYANGMHQICCKAVDSAGNVFEDSCRDICIDSVAPSNPVISFTDKCENSLDYTNEEIVFTWTNQSDFGCAPVMYMVEIYANGAKVKEYNTSSLYADMVDELGSQVNGYNYSIKVKSYDLAGNANSGWASSMVVWYDNQAPSIVITNITPQTLWGGKYWITGAFTVYENDSDANLMQDSCYIEVDDLGDGEGNIVSTSGFGCNNPVGVADWACITDGENTCKVTKYAQDKACNSAFNTTYLNVDKHAPVTNKTPEGNTYGNGIDSMSCSNPIACLNQMVHYFLGRTSGLYFNGTDAGVGCNHTYVEVSNSSGVVGTYSYDDCNGYVQMVDQFSDGVYTVSYYSVDHLGNEEIVQEEIDKVDNEAPVTIKTIGSPSYMDGYYITNHTSMILVGVDSEVGCNGTFWSIPDYKKGFDESCNASVDWTGLPDGVYELFFGSIDHLGNSAEQNQSHYVDNTPPIINILNPTDEEANSVQDCSLDVVFSALDLGAGVDSSTAAAKLEYLNGTVISEKSMAKVGSILYEAVFSLDGLEDGNYIVEAVVTDNLGNSGAATKPIYLADGIYIEYLNPSVCQVTAENGKCLLTFNACVRGSSSMDLLMEKLRRTQNPEGAGLVTPLMLNATIWKDGRNASVGFVQDSIIIEEPGRLDLSSVACIDVNGRIKVNLTMDFSQEAIETLGEGSYAVDYSARAYNCEEG